MVEQFGVPEGAHFPQLLACALYDVMAKVPCDVIWGPYRASERALAKELYGDLGPEDLLLMDRGFPSFEILDDLSGKKINFLVRLPKTGMFREVGEFLATGGVDGVVTIAPSPKLVSERLAAGLSAPSRTCQVPIAILALARAPRASSSESRSWKRFEQQPAPDLSH